MLMISLMSASLEGSPSDLQNICKCDFPIYSRFQAPEAACELGETIDVLWGISSITATAVTPSITQEAVGPIKVTNWNREPFLMFKRRL